MSIPDTDLRFWPTAPGDNLPTDGTFINRDLPKQWRNIKSNVRAESYEKEFEKRSEMPVSVTHAGGGLGSFSFLAGDGDLTSVFTVMRKIRLTNTATGDQIYASVVSSSFSTTTSVIISELTDEVMTGGSYYVDVGVDAPGMASLPDYTESGSITISGAATTGVATFARRQRDLDYFPKATVLSVVGDPTTGQAVIKGIAKTDTGMTLTLRTAPGVGNSTVIGWTIMRET